MRKAILTILILGVLPAGAEVEQDYSNQVLRLREFHYDAPYPARRNPWIERSRQQSGNSDYNVKKCGNLYRISRGRGSSLQCRYSVIALDFQSGALIAFVEFHEGGTLYARYLGAITGRPTDYFAGFNRPKPLKSTKLESLSRVLTRLSRAGTTFGQKHFVDGRIWVQALGKVIFDPLGHGFDIPRFDDNPFETGNLMVLTKREYFDVVGGKDIRDYEDPGGLYDAVGGTLNLLQGGLKSLMATSDEDQKDALREILVENAALIAGELRDVTDLMRTKNYQVVELVRFVRTLAGLSKSLDAILMAENGTDPDFYTIVREAIPAVQAGEQ